MNAGIALIGFGYWGPNLARAFNSLPNAHLVGLFDLSPESRRRFEKDFPGKRTYASLEDVLRDGDVQGVVVATPSATHYEIARMALESGKHVFVEKPLATKVAECLDLGRLAGRGRLVLMVGHLFLYNNAVRTIKNYIDSGLLGKVHYVYSQRLNLGIVRKDVNALWNFAPHDFSILDYWLGALPSLVRAAGYSYLQPGIEDVVFGQLDFPGGVGAHVHISWLDPHKVRKITVVGSKKMVTFDDTSVENRVVLYDKGIDPKPVTPAPGPAPFQGLDQFQLLVRSGDVTIPRIEYPEPLREECKAFADCIESGARPLTDAGHAARVTAVLEAADRSIRAGGVPQHVDQLPLGISKV